MGLPNRIHYTVTKGSCPELEEAIASGRAHHYRLTYVSNELGALTMGLPNRIHYIVAKDTCPELEEAIASGRAYPYRLTYHDGRIVYVSAVASRVDDQNVRFDIVGLPKEVELPTYGDVQGEK